MPGTPDYSGLLSCTVGAAASFEVITYEASVDPVIRPGMGHVADQVRATITGQIQGTSPDDLSARLDALAAALTDGQNIVINGLAGRPEFRCLAASCFDGGPFLGVKIADGPVALVKSITLAVSGGQLPNGSGQQGQNKYAVMTATRADGLRTATWDGEAVSATGATYFSDMVIAAFRDAYPAPKWSVRLEYKTAREGLIARTGYQLVATEQFGALPAYQSGNAVEGSISTRVERDEQMRKTTVSEFDLLLDGQADAQAVLGELRDGVTQQGQRLVLRESASIETLRENRVRASFTVLESGWHDALMNWNRTIRVVRDGQPAAEHRYLGADPLLILEPRRVGRITDSGTAAGAGVFVRPPDELYGDLPRAAPAEETYVDVNEAEKQTTWQRQYLIPLATAGTPGVLGTLDPNALARPEASQFYAKPQVDEPPNPNGTT